MGNIATGKEPIDMKRMESVIHRQVLHELNKAGNSGYSVLIVIMMTLCHMSQLEDSGHETFAFLCIGDFLYSQDKDEVCSRQICSCIMQICFVLAEGQVRSSWDSKILKKQTCRLLDRRIEPVLCICTISSCMRTYCIAVYIILLLLYIDHWRAKFRTKHINAG